MSRRAFLYAYGYRKPERARETISQAAPERLLCCDCASRRVSCVMGFDVKNRIMDVARVRDIPLLPTMSAHLDRKSRLLYAAAGVDVFQECAIHFLG